MSSIRDTAEKIIRSGGGRAGFDFNKAVDRVEKALRDERERAAKIVNQFGICRDHDQPSHCVHCDLRHKAIAAIRKQDD